MFLLIVCTGVSLHPYYAYLGALCTVFSQFIGCYQRYLLIVKWWRQKLLAMVRSRPRSKWVKFITTLSAIFKLNIGQTFGNALLVWGNLQSSSTKLFQAFKIAFVSPRNFPRENIRLLFYAGKLRRILSTRRWMFPFGKKLFLSLRRLPRPYSMNYYIYAVHLLCIRTFRTSTQL